MSPWRSGGLAISSLSGKKRQTKDGGGGSHNGELNRAMYFVVDIHLNSHNKF